MYFLSNMGIFQPAMLVYQRVYFLQGWHHFFFRWGFFVNQPMVVAEATPLLSTHPRLEHCREFERGFLGKRNLSVWVTWVPKKVTNRRIASQKELTLLRFSIWTPKTYLKHQTSGGIWISWDTIWRISYPMFHQIFCIPTVITGCLNHQQKAKILCWNWRIKIIPCPRCSMYGIFTYLHLP